MVSGGRFILTPASHRRVSGSNEVPGIGSPQVAPLSHLTEITPAVRLLNIEGIPGYV